MAVTTDAGAEPRLPLSRERVLAAAVVLADESGIDSLSMRRLADQLGVKAMSLYNHVAGKDAVLDGILEAVASEIATPAPGTEWKAAIREVAVSAHEALLRHAWASRLWATRPSLSAGRLRYMDSLLGSLRTAGFSADLTYHAYHILDSFVMGYTSTVLNYRSMDTSRLEDAAQSFLQDVALDEYPHFAEHVRQHLVPEHAPHEMNALELGLDLILDGVERMRDAES